MEKQGAKVLVVGSGAREHALVWKLKHSKRVERIFCAPGNAGIGQLAKLVNLKPENIRGIADFASRNRINLTIIGPEKPLTMGIADEFQRRKLKMFGPGRSGAQLESSKVFAKEFMQKYHIPTAPFRVFSMLAEAIGFCRTVEYPVVVKADGLAAGKGVFVCDNIAEATGAIYELMDKRIFGAAGAKIVIESFARGEEISMMAITDGSTILPFLSSQDHKRAYDADKGPNTGGMGAYAPTTFLTESTMREINDHIFSPTIAGLKKEGIAFQGVLYAGLMLTAFGPKVLEFNVRLGDPETQVILPLLKTDLYELLLAAAEKKLSSIGELQWNNMNAAGVVMASRGYPGKHGIGQRISGLQNQYGPNSLVFHAATRRDNNNWLTAGGRVLTVVGLGDKLDTALMRAYEQVKKIRFDGAQYRKDIGFRASNSLPEPEPSLSHDILLSSTTPITVPSEESAIADEP